ncbi:type IV toxin-antitoxin system AbiEi family antitoxin domain-containing protein [Anaeromyxobacter oryzisoli]|uniref:type IV toxin-antitoxin system AbiEi family antitoxin domain-containing protein n=1 Tax=Anaeromyxobacter oryzisoli TaxID=2925408 RepID=UPI001F581826|nr:type IV toxin-antitoxin system AbiEi family antitoxin domain-containing protein [Anaeromyxobacter sp. SG63]
MGQTKKPSWDELFEVASGQEGLFTASQAAAAGYYRQLLRRYLESGRVRRVRRGIYRIVHYPPGEHEELSELWLWSKEKGVFSHETALSLHGLSDVLPKRVHLTVPADWKRRRLAVPRGVVLHHGTIHPEERAWVGPVPVTEPGRTLLDCAQAHLSPDLLAQAFRQARSRGLLAPARLDEISRAAGVFGVPG